MEEKNVFTAKTVEEALDEGLKTLGLTLAEADYEVIEEGKKKLFGSVKAKVRIIPKLEEGKRATNFIDGLLSIMGVKAESEIVSDGENLTINIKTENSARVIGKRGDVLDAIQCMAGAVANIGRDEYKKVVVDCENYRAQREQTLKELAQKLAKNGIMLILCFKSIINTVYYDNTLRAYVACFIGSNIYQCLESGLFSRIDFAVTLSNADFLEIWC